MLSMKQGGALTRAKMQGSLGGEKDDANFWPWAFSPPEQSSLVVLLEVFRKNRLSSRVSLIG